MTKHFDLESVDMKTLRENSEEYFEVMKLIYYNNQFPHRQIMHNGHIAVELLLKSFIRKNGASYPKTHDIQTLCQWSLTEENGKNFSLYNILVEAGLLTHYRGIRYAWAMSDRYTRGRVTKTEVIRLYNSFKEVITWIRMQC